MLKKNKKMKHLIAKEHHKHLKRRAFIEIGGFIILIAISINQRQLLGTAVEAIRMSDVLFLILLFLMYWIMLPLTAISYRLLSHKNIPLGTTIIAQLAASGPGRIIPGGLGHISIGSVHLQKSGLTLQRAIIVTVTNNLIGVFTNIAMVTIAIAYHPTLLSRIVDNLSIRTLSFVALILIISAGIIQWLSHIRSTKKTIRKVTAQWKHLRLYLIRNPHRLLLVLGIAILITLGHVSMLLLAGEAIEAHIQFSDALIALSAGVFIGGALPTPGGLGAVEAGTTSALILLGYDPILSTSVALLFRTATYWQPLLPGIFAYLYLRERDLL